MGIILALRDTEKDSRTRIGVLIIEAQEKVQGIREKKGNDNLNHLFLITNGDSSKEVERGGVCLQLGPQR